MISVFDENYNRNYFFDNNQSMLDFNRDDLDYSQKYLNDELISFDQSIEIENQKMIDLWNDGKSDDNTYQIQEKTTAFKTNNKNNKKCYNIPLELLENIKIEEDKSPEIFSFNDIKGNIFKNDLYKNKFLFDVNNMFIDKKLESTFLKKKRFRDDNEDNFLNEFMENEKIENNEQENHKKRGRKSKKLKDIKFMTK